MRTTLSCVLERCASSSGTWSPSPFNPLLPRGPPYIERCTHFDNMLVRLCQSVNALQDRCRGSLRIWSLTFSWRKCMRSSSLNFFMNSVRCARTRPSGRITHLCLGVSSASVMMCDRPSYKLSHFSKSNRGALEDNWLNWDDMCVVKSAFA